MRSGRLRYPITIQQSTSTMDAYGQPIHSWSTHASVMCDMQPLAGREYYTAQQVDAELNTKITVRMDESIKPEMRVYIEGRVLDIVSARHFDRFGETVLMCKEHVE